MAAQLGYKHVYRDPYGFPKWQEYGLPIGSTPAGLTATAEAAAGPQGDPSFQGWGMLWTLLGIFAGGLALNLTPWCLSDDSHHRLLFRWSFGRG